VFVVDTNVLLYAADVSSPAHARCRHLLETWRASHGAWHLSWPIVYEFLRVITHPRVFKAPWGIAAAWQFVNGLLAAPGLGMLLPTERHASVLDELLQATPTLSGSILHDAHTVALMREHGVRSIYTRDTDFHRFTGVEVMDPMHGASPS